MISPLPPRSPRVVWRAALARASALVAACLLAVAVALPAHALGEDGPFELPVTTEELPIIPEAVTAVPIAALIDDDAASELDLSTARLTPPDQLSSDELDLVDLGENGRTLGIAGEGTWSLIGEDLVFTPLEGETGPELPIALSVESVHGTRSFPVPLTPRTLDSSQIELRGGAGERVRFELDVDVPEDGQVRLDLDGLPAGAAVAADGSRVVIPGDGRWQLSADGTVVTFTPDGGAGPRSQPHPVRYVVDGAEGTAVDTGLLEVTIPRIENVSNAERYGQDVEFELDDGLGLVEPEALVLEGPPGAEDTSDAADGTELDVPGQGTWLLDRDAATVRFSPADDEVREVAAVTVRATDDDGHAAAPAQLRPAYPVLLDAAGAAEPESPVLIDLGTGMRDLDARTLRFDTESLPEGARATDDAQVVTVPGEGQWTLDRDAGIVEVAPEAEFRGELTPLGIVGEGGLAPNAASATLSGVVTADVPTLRDDEERTAPEAEVSIDVLANDTASSGSHALVPESMQLRSLDAANLSELAGYRGSRLVIPGEGEFTVSGSGAVTFVPESGFTGQTTPVQYVVRDSGGVPLTASLTIEVDPSYAAEPTDGTTTGINTLLAGLLPATPSALTTFATIVVLLLFGGGASLWIGLRIEADRRTWED